MEENIKLYDFKKPQRYSNDNVRFLSVVCEEFCKNINTFLTYELKNQNIHCKLEKVEQTNYDEFLNIIDKDSVIAEHSIEPLVHGLIFQIDKKIALTVIDIALGGNDLLENYNRNLTEIDKQLLFQMISDFLKRMYVIENCTHREVSKVHTSIRESKKYPLSESVLIAHIKVMYQDREIGKIRFCEPYSCMQPVLGVLETKKLFKNKNKETDEQFSNEIYTNVCESKIELTAHLGKTTIKVSEFLDLKIGDVIGLDTKANGEMDLDVSQEKVFKCIPGLIKNKYGVLITDSIRKGE